MSIRTEFLVSICEVFEMRRVAYVGADPTFAEEIQKLIPNLEGPSPDTMAQIVFLDRCYGTNPRDVIVAGLSMTAPNGFLMGTDYTHNEETGLPVQAALTDIFNLMMVQVGPDAVWAVRKAA